MKLTRRIAAAHALIPPTSLAWVARRSLVTTMSAACSLMLIFLDAHATQCKEHGGPAVCSAPVLGTWEYQFYCGDWGPEFTSCIRAMSEEYREPDCSFYCVPTVVRPITREERFESKAREFPERVARGTNNGPCGPSTSAWRGWSLVEQTSNGHEVRGAGFIEVSALFGSFNICVDPYLYTYAKAIKAIRTRRTTCPPGFNTRVIAPQVVECWRLQETDSCAPEVGNPISIATGSKRQREKDWRRGAAGKDALRFERFYNAHGYFVAPTIGQADHLDGLGPLWRHTYQRQIIPASTARYTAILHGEDFSVRYFDANGYEVDQDSGDVDQLLRVTDGAGVTVGWRFQNRRQGRVEHFDARGRLIKIEGSSGAALSLTYLGENGHWIPSGATPCEPPVGAALSSGRLACVTDSFGAKISFGYDGLGRLTRVRLPSGEQIAFSYDEASSIVLPGRRPINNLTSVTFQDGRRRVYHYNEQAFTQNLDQPLLLTGVSEENDRGETVRLATFRYDTLGRAIGSERAGGANRYAMSYTAPYLQTVVTDPLGSQRTFDFTVVGGRLLLTRQSQPAGAGCGPASSSITYDGNGNVTSRTDFNGVKTCYAYDLSRNLETRRVEGLAADADCAAALSSPPTSDAVRVVSTEWHPDWRLETRRAEPKKITTTVYNGYGASCAPADALVEGKPIAVACSRTEQATTDETGALGFAATVTGAARTWSYTYNRHGQVLTEDGPRTDVADITTYSYYDSTTADWTRGDLAAVTNAAGHVTRFTRYDRSGRLLTRIDPNGLVTNYTYDARGRLTIEDAGGELTAYTYDAAGNLVRVTLPDGGYVAYTYDAAHRLTEIADHVGNRIVYTLDAMGNRVGEQVIDAAGQLVRNLTRAIDALNRVQQVSGAQ